MTNKILKSILFVVLSVLVTSVFVISLALDQYFLKIQKEQLKDELSLAAYAVRNLGTDYLNELDYNRYRLTWVSPTGEVLFESHADSSSMENHGDREEIMEAYLYGSGSSTRNSKTLLQKTIYEAQRLEDGSVLRISISRVSSFVLMLGMVQPIFIILIVAVLLSLYLAKRMSLSIIKPLNSLNLENPLENDVYEELSPLLHRINEQHLEIQNQLKILKHKQEEFDQIVINMKEGLLLLNNEGKILSMNPFAKKVFNVDEEIIAEDFLLLDRSFELQAAIKDAKEKGRSHFRREIEDKIYHFEITRIEQEGMVQGLVVLIFDISEEVHAEKHRREFTANVSHELKTPLQTIIGSVELIEQGLVKKEDQAQFLGRIHREASRLINLIDDIIHLSKIDEEAAFTKEEISLKEVVLEVYDDLSEKAKKKNIHFNEVKEDVKILAVYSLIYEIIYNLVDNAIKYNKENGDVEIILKKDKEGIHLTTNDTGIGIPFKDQEKIFERFYRVDKSHSKKTGGTGLGLSIVKHAVLYHEGSIKLSSELNKGTSIDICFPIKKDVD